MKISENNELSEKLQYVRSVGSFDRSKINNYNNQNEYYSPNLL